jgi:hypothetical protein
MSVSKKLSAEMKALGFIPFAPGRVENGKLIKTCPECGVDLNEATDAYGEQTSDRYAKHYQSEH